MNAQTLRMHTAPSRALAKVALASALVVFAAGCATQQQNNTAVGTGGGAAVGAALGAIFGGGSGAAIGAGAGAVAGGIVGYNWTSIKQKIQGSAPANSGIAVQEQPDGSLKVNVPSSVSFDTASYAIKPDLFPVLDSVAQTLSQNPTLKAKAIGHTDSTGQASLNQTLSVNRAESVTRYLEGKGVAASRLMAEGMGPNSPIADNNTVEGRAANRRTEIYLYATKS